MGISLDRQLPEAGDSSVMPSVVTVNTVKKDSLLAQVSGLTFAILMVLAACTISLVIRPAIPVLHPVVLIVAAIALWLPLNAPVPILLQKLVGLYLICLPVNEIASQSFAFTLRDVHISISYSLIVVLIGTLGYWFGKRRLPSGTGLSILFPAWGLTVGLIGLHLLALYFLLRTHYGFGYESNVSVLGHVFLYFLLFLVSWRNLEYVIFRRSTGIVFMVYCILALFIGS